MALIVECENGHGVGIKKNSADFAVFNGVLQIQCALCKNNGNNVWVDFGPAPTNDVLNITTLGEDKLFTKEMCYDILKKKSYIKKKGVTTDKTYMTLSALKSFVTNVFTGDAGVTTTCSKSTNNDYYPLESEISIVGKQYQTFIQTGPDIVYEESVVLTNENDRPTGDDVINGYHFYTKHDLSTATILPIYVVGNGTPPTTKQISVKVKYKNSRDGDVVGTETVSKSNMTYTNVDGIKFVFGTARYDWFGIVGNTKNKIFFGGFA